MTVEQPARPATADELREVVERISEKTGKPLKPKIVNPAAVAFGDKAEAAGWRVEYRVARGPLTTRHKPDEPNEEGKYALVSVTRTVDTIGVRAQHPDGRRIAAWWVGDKLGEGWAASPRSNPRELGIQALTAYLTEEETVSDNGGSGGNEPRGPVSALAEKSRASFEAWHTARRPEFPEDEKEAAELVAESYIAGYVVGRAHAAEEAGDAYGEGYAAGLAAATGHAVVRVQTRKRLKTLRTGDVVLGRNGHRYIVSISHAEGRDWAVTANGATGTVQVQGHPSRMVDVEEDLAVADALATLKDALDAEAVPA